MDYLGLVQTKYNLNTVFGPNGQLLVALAYDEQGQLFIERWDIPSPQPTIAELEAYAASPEYLAAWSSRLKAEAEVQVNAWANQKVIEFKILIDELFYVAMIANIGFLSQKWVRLGRPAELDPLSSSASMPRRKPTATATPDEGR
ncbi:MAG: hypothetical protein HS126_22130 [Anaerolineales bacterium]|nr:hypothetical protein [Anaerolineales bacterium]